MSTERAEAALESAIAAHVAASFQRNDRGDEPETTAAQIRSRITDRFQAVEIPTEQDNQPPALVVFYRRIAAAFAPIAREPESAERSSSLADLEERPRDPAKRSAVSASEIQAGSCQDAPPDRAPAIADAERIHGRFRADRGLDPVDRRPDPGSPRSRRHRLGAAASGAEHCPVLADGQTLQSPAQKGRRDRRFGRAHRSDASNRFLTVGTRSERHDCFRIAAAIAMS